MTETRENEACVSFHVPVVAREHSYLVVSQLDAFGVLRVHRVRIVMVVVADEISANVHQLPVAQHPLGEAALIEQKRPGRFLF